MNKGSHSAGFSAFDLSPPILTAISALDFSQATDVQCDVIPAVLQGRDILAGAETGSGKTAAYAIPLLQKLLYQRDREGRFAARGNHVRVLVLVPTRELALQVSEDIALLAQHIQPKVNCLPVFGGVSVNPQMMALRGGVDVLVGTPGRVLDLVDHNAIKFNKLETLVVDEVDKLITTAFLDEIESILKLLPNKRQNLMFTATLPASIRLLVRRILVEPLVINIAHSQADLIEQRVYTVDREKKNELLAELIRSHDWQQLLIFCSAKKSCNHLVTKLAAREIEAVAMHSDIAQKRRIDALQGFKNGSIRILIATDVAARGIDVVQLPCVINFELPRSPNDYIHRIGRTGRAGQAGLVISLIAHHEYQHFSVIEKRCDFQLERLQLPGFEAAEEAPPPPLRNKPKKKRNKLSKKKRQLQQERLALEKKRETLKPLVKRKSSRKTGQELFIEDDDDDLVPQTASTEKGFGWRRSNVTDKPPAARPRKRSGSRQSESRVSPVESQQRQRNNAQANQGRKNRLTDDSAQSPWRHKQTTEAGVRSGGKEKSVWNERSQTRKGQENPRGKTSRIKPQQEKRTDNEAKPSQAKTLSAAEFWKKKME